MERRSDSFISPEPVSCSLQGSNCCFLTGIQVYQETGKMVYYSHINLLLDTGWPFRGTKSAPSTRTLDGTQCRIPHPSNKQNKTQNQSADRIPRDSPKYTTSNSLTHQRGKKNTSSFQNAGTSHPQHKDNTDHWTKLTHQGQKPKGRRNTALSPGKGDRQWSKLEKKKLKRQRNRE